MRVNIGNIGVGGGAPVSIQSMTNTNTSDILATAAQINLLAANGCDIARVAVPDMRAAEALWGLKHKTSIPLVADIHYDYRLAVAAIEHGADKIRINPGNIGSIDNLKKIIDAAKLKKIPIRIGINGGSLERDILEKYKCHSADALVESAIRNIKIFNKFGFYDIVVSVKSSNVKETINAYKMIKEQPYPLHLGITEAGVGEIGLVKSSIGIGALLAMGIGDTIRVSLTADPIEEVKAAQNILQALSMKNFVEVISCPTCARCSIDVISIANQVSEAVCGISKGVKIAIMGCVVNGIGEAKEADFGIAGVDGGAVLFEKGDVVRKIASKDIVGECLRRVNDMKIKETKAN